MSAWSAVRERIGNWVTVQGSQRYFLVEQNTRSPIQYSRRGMTFKSTVIISERFKLGRWINDDKTVTPAGVQPMLCNGGRDRPTVIGMQFAQQFRTMRNKWVVRWKQEQLSTLEKHSSTSGKHYTNIYQYTCYINIFYWHFTPIGSLPEMWGSQLRQAICMIQAASAKLPDSRSCATCLFLSLQWGRVGWCSCAASV